MNIIAANDGKTDSDLLRQTVVVLLQQYRCAGHIAITKGDDEDQSPIPYRISNRVLAWDHRLRSVLPGSILPLRN